MHFETHRAREKRGAALQTLEKRFGNQVSDFADAEWLDASFENVIGAAGLPFFAPLCEQIMNHPSVCVLFEGKEKKDHLFVYNNHQVRYFTGDGEITLTEDMKDALLFVFDQVITSVGVINERGEQIIDLTSLRVGPHFNVNLLIGDRESYPNMLFTTPKSALDAFGAGSFRAGGALQVLATRYTLSPEENGEPANRQFYIVEDGRQIFYSLDAHTNVKSAFCRHSRNYSVITYETCCGLKITRTIFILPQEEAMPDAVELQSVMIENTTDHSRNLRIVFTGMFSLCSPETTVNDVVYANIVHESEVVSNDSSPIAVSLHSKPANFASERRFALLLSEGETMDDFCMSLPAFIGSGTLLNPSLLTRLPSRLERKMAPFFAMGKTFILAPGRSRQIDSFACMAIRYDGSDASAHFDATLQTLLDCYRAPHAAAAALARVQKTQESLCSYLEPMTGDKNFDSYVGGNLPFQVYYQTFVSRSFAWTQKAYRETGFREIQDIYASMYYMTAAGRGKDVRDLISMWASNVFHMGYANHDFTWVGKEPGDCSDDQLWLVQAVYRYVSLSGDKDFLLEEFPVADGDGSRSLWDTMIAILEYSGDISVGAHKLPLLDKADWNDTLRLDKTCLKGPQKEALYRKQLSESGKPWGTPFENTLTESCMNACLLKIAADQITILAKMIGKTIDGKYAEEMSAGVADSMRKNAWRKDYFARALINDDREGGYKYLGITGDGLSMDPSIDGTYFLNSYSWAILADIATEEQIELMIEVVERFLKTNAGLKLCTLVDFDRLGTNTATALYFPGDRENGGVFKHAAMMAVVASLKAAKFVENEKLAVRLVELADYMMVRTLPYKTMNAPYITKGNPRFCTQYNNSETGENIGPILSGTATWLTLAVFEAFGFSQSDGKLRFSPVLQNKSQSLSYKLKLDQDETVITVEIVSKNGAFRVGKGTHFTLDGLPCASEFPVPCDGVAHNLIISL